MENVSVVEKLLTIVQEKRPEEYGEVIAETKSWPVMYHLSQVRGNILNWYPFETEATVLELGAECGALTRTLAAQTAKVVAVEGSEISCRVNAKRNADCTNIEIKTMDIAVACDKLQEKFDYITLIGGLEREELFGQQIADAKELLTKLSGLLKPEGKLLIAVGNQLGLKFFAGCKEEVSGSYFEGLEGNRACKKARTYSKKGLTELLEKSGYEIERFYYPYPDYKLPTAIYSDDFLPVKGELSNNARNFDMDRMVLFDETKTWDTIIDAGLFQEMSNSFLVEATRR